MKIELTVVVDDFLSSEGASKGAVPAHGLGVKIRISSDEGEDFKLLCDGGPSLRILEYNSLKLGEELDDIDLLVGLVWSTHHIAAPLSLARRTCKRILLPAFPKQKPHRVEGVKELEGAVLLPLKSPIFNERVLLLSSNRGYIAIVACSIYGVDVALMCVREYVDKMNQRLAAIIGGFNLSTFDTYGLRLLEKVARRYSAFVLPLHSTSVEAREKLVKTLGLEEVPGVGTRVVFE